MRLLLVEDDLGLGRALQAVLQNDGHDVTWVRLGADCTRLLGERRYDALLLDLGLPDCDGVDLLRGLRAAGHGLPGILITARESLEDRLKGFDGGADDYLIKPFDIPELLARLRALVRRAAGAGAVDEVWRAGALVLDARAMSAVCAGAPVNLSRTEFSLLHALVRHAGRIVTRAELEQDVLPYSEGQTLDVHISNLRKKIGDGHIRTVRGVGYMVGHAQT